MIKKEFGKEWMHGTAVSSLKGRLRLNVPGLEFLFEERNEVAQALAKIAGVQRVRVTPRIGSVLLEYDEQRTAASEVLNQTNLVMARYAMNANRVRHSDEKGESTMTVKRLVGRLAVNAAGFLLGNTVFKGSLFGNKLGIINSIPALCSIGFSAPMVRGAWEGLKKDLRPNADFLTVTSIVASLMLGTPHSALMILALSDLAELMTSYTIERTRSSIKKMLSADDGDVWKVLEDGRVARTPIAQLHAGDTVAVHTGEKIAVDGVIASGVAVIDQSAITGEFVPVEKRAGDEVFAGTVVKSGNIQVKANKVGDQTVVARIVGMVEASELKKAPIQRYADKFSNYLVPLNFLLCLSVWLVTHNAQKALKMLVIDYSCGIKLSTATAFSAAINTAVKQGVLIKGGAYIEQMSGANTVLLDKTGTVTTGQPAVTDVKELDARLLPVAHALEAASAHPLAAAVTAYCEEKNIPLSSVTDFSAPEGQGLCARLEGETVWGGNARLAAAMGCDISALSAAAEELAAKGRTPLYFGAGTTPLGLIAVADPPRETSAAAIAALRQMGLSVLLLTGDHRRTAEAIAKEVGIPRVIPEVLPQQKEAVIRSLQEKGEVVAMVGDGINDAPALVRADIGIAIGAGTDIAIDSADIVLMHSDPADIPAALQLSRSVLRNIKQNLFWAFLYNTIGIPIAAGVFYTALHWKLNPMLASAAMSLSSVCVVSNALRLRGWKPRFPALDSVPPVTEVECTLLPQESVPASAPAEPQSQPAITAAPQTVTLTISGMMCNHCVGRVKAALEALPGVTAEVNLAKNTAIVTMAEPHSAEELTAAVEAAGYQVTKLE